jgi:hypothetical protein
LSTGQILVYFEHSGNRFLHVLGPGLYQTTDQQKCKFQVHGDGTVTW